MGLQTNLLAQMTLFCAAGGVLQAAVNLSSRDAYVRREGADWVLGTSVVEKKVALADGRLTLTSLRNKRSQHEYAGPGTGNSEIGFRIDGRDAGSSAWRWELDGEDTRRLSQGELQLDLRLRSRGITVTQHYVLYPGTAVLRQWLSIRNDSGTPVSISDLYFLNSKIGGKDVVQLHYITGGGNYNGSQLLKTEPITETYNHVFDSHGGIQKESYSAYLPLLVLENQRSHDGLAIGWDYLGHWIGRVEDAGIRQLGISLQVAGYEKRLAPGEQIETPKAFTTAYSGDLDALGNELLDWQYEYLWEFTNPEYFAKTRWAVDWPAPWVGNGGTPSADNWGRRLALDLRYVDLLREAGGDILWDDAGWYDAWGNWNGPDWQRATAYLRKHDMRWVLWQPTFLATPESKVIQSHPDWLIRNQQAFEQSLPATADWQKALLDRNVREWGDFQWRYDIAPAVSANDTEYLQSDQNFRVLLQRFKISHPKSGVDACYGGGRWISYDLARLAESGEYTDGGVGPYSGYYTSMIVPPDKLHNVSDFDHTYYDVASDHVHLSMNPTWYRDPGDGADVEAIRRDWDIFHYLVAQGVAGRWSHIFRPRVTNDDPTWYFERMNRDGSKGVILIKHAKTGPAYYLVSKPVRNADKDHYLGGPAEMNGVVTSPGSGTTLDTGVYEDPVDGGYRYYGAPGELFGPLNFKYSTANAEQPFVTALIKKGAGRTMQNRFFGMAIQTGSESLTVTQLGQFDSGHNRGTYELMVVRAADKAVLAATTLDMSRGAVDSQGFKYVKLSRPLRLEPGPGKPVVIFPGGLSKDAIYDVRTYKSRFHEQKSGADLTDAGISLPSIGPGEMIFLNLPKYPGAGTDATPPGKPANVTKRLANNLGIQGIEISWSSASDDNWISYYEILNEGQVIAKTAKGSFYFDHSPDNRNRLSARYEVRTVDGDGNKSATVVATEIAGDPLTYEALGDFGPAQGGSNWKYQESVNGETYRDLSWDSGGYEGRWTGSGLGRIGRIWMQPAAVAEIARTFVVPVDSVVSVDGGIEKDPSTESGGPVFARVLLNNRQIWPATGWASIPAYGAPLACKVTNVHAGSGDIIRFVLKRNGDNRPEPVIWDPVITLQRGS